MFPENKIRQNIYNKTLGEEAKGPSAALWLEGQSPLLAGGGQHLERKCLPVQRVLQAEGSVCVCENTFFCQAGSVCVRSHGVYDKLYLLFFKEEVE